MHPTREPAPHTAGKLIRHARLYDLLGTKMSGGRDTLLDLAAPAAGEAVLDVGCGTGKLALAIAARPGTVRVTGIDASPEMIGVARDKAIRSGAESTSGSD